MGSHLKANLTEIGKVGKLVNGLAGEFDQATKVVTGFQPFVGSAELSSTLGSFATNWSVHREKLIDDMKQESKLAETAVTAYNGTDQSLTNALRKQEDASG